MVVNVLMGAIPPIIYLCLIYRYLFKEREPKEEFMGYLIFLIGMLCVLPVSHIETIYLSNGFSDDYKQIFLENFFIVGICEEFCKLAILSFIIEKRFTSKGIIPKPTVILFYAICGAIGFATMENMIYLINGGLLLALLRAFTSVVMHICTSITIGFAYNLSQKRDNKVYIFIGLIVGMLQHAIFNLVALTVGDGSLLYFIVAMYLILSINLTEITISNK